MFDKLDAEIRTFVIKIIIPAFVAVSISIAIKSQMIKISLFNVLGSFIIGVGGAYLCGDLVLSTVRTDLIPITISLIALSSEKIGYWILYKFNIEKLLVAALEYFLGLVKK